MKNRKIRIDYTVFENMEALPKEDAALLLKARQMVKKAYAPYSRFRVGAAARMKNGKIVAGANQENAAYPVTICAERVLLSNAAMQFGDMPIQTMAVSYANENENTSDDHPISPCGVCRQALVEHEHRFGVPVRLILGGTSGEVIVIESVKSLLPLSFTGEDMA